VGDHEDVFPASIGELIHGRHATVTRQVGFRYSVAIATAVAPVETSAHRQSVHVAPSANRVEKLADVT
jgi:hypothetical protein